MRIKINLDYVLQKNNMTLTSFLEETGITTYNQLLQHCDENNFNPVEESVFNSSVKPAKLAEKKEKVADESQQTTAPKKNTRRSTSSTPAKKRSRSRAKKTQTAQ